MPNNGLTHLKEKATSELSAINAAISGLIMITTNMGWCNSIIWNVSQTKSSGAMFAVRIAPLAISRCKGILLDSTHTVISLSFLKLFIPTRLFQSQLDHRYRHCLYNGKTLILIVSFKILKYSSYHPSHHLHNNLRVMR